MTELHFTPEGNLLPGDHPLTFHELRGSMLVTGSHVKSRSWDSIWRLHLVDNIEALTRELWRVGIERVFADGSFVEDKDHPIDIDGYFEVPLERLASGSLQRDLNRLSPHKSWTWSPTARRRVPGFQKLQLPMWLHYRVELYPHVPGLMSGITDEYGNDLEFPAAFRRSRRDGAPRGIVELKRHAP